MGQIGDDCVVVITLNTPRTTHYPPRTTHLFFGFLIMLPNRRNVKRGKEFRREMTLIIHVDSGLRNALQVSPRQRLRTKRLSAASSNRFSHSCLGMDHKLRRIHLLEDIPRAG